MCCSYRTHLFFFSKILEFTIFSNISNIFYSGNSKQFGISHFPIKYFFPHWVSRSELCSLINKICHELTFFPPNITNVHQAHIMLNCLKCYANTTFFFLFKNFSFLSLVCDVLFLDVDPKKPWRTRTLSIVLFSFLLQIFSLTVNWDYVNFKRDFAGSLL